MKKPADPRPCDGCGRPFGPLVKERRGRLLKQAIAFLRRAHGPDVFAPFLGQDWRAFETFVYALRLYAHADAGSAPGALTAMAGAALMMQPTTVSSCRDAIPGVLTAIPCEFEVGELELVWPLVVARMDVVAQPGKGARPRSRVSKGKKKPA